MTQGQVVVVQAADLIQSRKLVPDLATWMQCFGLFTAAVARKRPESIPDLMAYMTIIARASQKYRWPSWAIYDQNFRLEVVGNPDQGMGESRPKHICPVLYRPISKSGELVFTMSRP